MTTTRKQYSPKFKAKVAVEAIRGERTLSQLATQYPGHRVQSALGLTPALAHWGEVLGAGPPRTGRDSDAEKDALYEQIGRLKVELDWLKKKVGLLD